MLSDWNWIWKHRIWIRTIRWNASRRRSIPFRRAQMRGTEGTTPNGEEHETQKTNNYFLFIPLSSSIKPPPRHSRAEECWSTSALEFPDSFWKPWNGTDCFYAVKFIPWKESTETLDTGKCWVDSYCNTDPLNSVVEWVMKINTHEREMIEGFIVIVSTQYVVICLFNA